MKIIHYLFLSILLVTSSAAFAVSADTPVLGAGSFSQEYSFTTSSFFIPITSLSLSGQTSDFSSLSFQLLNSNGTPVTSPASLSIFNATPSGNTLSASFSDFFNPYINLNSSTNYLMIVSGNALSNGVQYDLWGNWLMSGSQISLVPPVPEPEIYVMLMAGVGLIGFASRRRKNG
ncbi:MAG TPA: FxDxF family PEP-CTERM protein [Rhodocyclaceae bacterium]|jgi:hypothetical protein|nr:FxDxF family PEP-CTERM protein [Rhodocyclaceae bacterium]